MIFHIKERAISLAAHSVSLIEESHALAGSQTNTPQVAELAEPVVMDAPRDDKPEAEATSATKLVQSSGKDTRSLKRQVSLPCVDCPNKKIKVAENWIDGDETIVAAVMALGNLQDDKIEHMLLAQQVVRALTTEEKDRLRATPAEQPTTRPCVDGPVGPGPLVPTTPPRRPEHPTDGAIVSKETWTGRKNKSKKTKKRNAEQTLGQRLAIGYDFLEWQKLHHPECKDELRGSREFIKTRLHGSDNRMLRGCVRLVKLDKRGMLPEDKARFR